MVTTRRVLLARRLPCYFGPSRRWPGSESRLADTGQHFNTLPELEQVFLQCTTPHRYTSDTSLGRSHTCYYYNAKRDCHMVEESVTTPSGSMVSPSTIAPGFPQSSLASARLLPDVGRLIPMASKWHELNIHLSLQRERYVRCVLSVNTKFRGPITLHAAR